MTTSPELENLAKIGQVKRETPVPAEVELRRAATAILERTAAMQDRPADGLILLLEHRPQGWWHLLEFAYG